MDADGRNTWKTQHQNITYCGNTVADWAQHLIDQTPNITYCGSTVADTPTTSCKTFFYFPQKKILSLNYNEYPLQILD